MTSTHLDTLNVGITKFNKSGFYFRMGNTNADKTVNFNMVNFCKPDSLYNHGLRIFVFSEKAYAATGKSWHVGGKDISYF